MSNLFKILFFTSIPGVILTIILAVNWNALFSDLEYEAKTQAGSYYEQNKPSLIDDLAGKFGDWAGGAGAGEEESGLPLSTPCLNYQGKVVFVADGDTIIVSDEKKSRHKIRFRGIDAPESAQDFGDQSKKNLSGLISDKTVFVETCEMDRVYPDREISLVRLPPPDNRSVNEIQVGNGYAHYYKEFSANLSPAERLALAEAEADAKRNARGLWINPHPTLPKDFRRFTTTAGSAP